MPLDAVGSSAYRTQNHAFGLAFKSANHLLEAKLGVQDLPYQLYPNQRMDMLDNAQHRANLRYRGQFDWGALDARVYRETVKHLMDFGADKRYWYGTLSGAGAPCSPIGGPPNSCAAGMPMETQSSNAGASIKARIALGQQGELRMGAEYHRYRLDDWWAPSGGGMWPGTFWNIADGQRDRSLRIESIDLETANGGFGIVGHRLLSRRHFAAVTASAIDASLLHRSMPLQTLCIDSGRCATTIIAP